MSKSKSEQFLSNDKYWNGFCNALTLHQNKWSALTLNLLDLKFNYHFQTATKLTAFSMYSVKVLRFQFDGCNWVSFFFPFFFTQKKGQLMNSQCCHVFLASPSASLVASPTFFPHFPSTFLTDDTVSDHSNPNPKFVAVRFQTQKTKKTNKIQI